MTRFIRPLLIALLLAGAAATAHADQLQWLPEKAAKAAAAELKPGTLFVDWVAHGGDTPQLLRVETVSTAEVEPGFFTVSVQAKPLIASIPSDDPHARQLYRFYEEPPFADAEPMVLDLAYVYVASSELPATFVNLGKKLGLDADIRHVAIELPADLLKRVKARPAQAKGGMQDMLLGEEPKVDDDALED